MNNTLIRSILSGLLIGAALFIMPFFLLRLVVFIFIFGALIRLVRGGRRVSWGWGRGYGYMPAFADRIRQMSDEEYSQFKQRFAHDQCGKYESRRTPEKPTDETSINA